VKNNMNKSKKIDWFELEFDGSFTNPIKEFISSCLHKERMVTKRLLKEALERPCLKGSIKNLIKQLGN